MNATETAAVLAYFAAAWPDKDFPTQTVDVWVDACADLDPIAANTAMRRMVKQENWFPTIARFRAAVAAEEHAQRNQFAARAGLPSPEPVGEPPKALLAAIRAMVADMKKNQRKHWHGGPNPCEVCGGIDPKLRRKATA
jgi:hypothetical protein